MRGEKRGQVREKGLELEEVVVDLSAGLHFVSLSVYE
jgi:hypothetical protein